MTEFVGLSPKPYSYLIDDEDGSKKTKSTKQKLI